MLEISRVVDAWGEQHDLRVQHAFGRNLGQRFAQAPAVIIDRHQRHAGEQIGEGAAHEVAILNHIGDAGRRPGIIFEHPEVTLLVADDVDAADMDIGAETDGEILHLRPVIGIPEYEIGRNDAIAQDVAFVVYVMQEGVDGRHALLDAGFKLAPFGGGDDPRNAVEREDAIDGCRIGIDGEGDPETHEVVFCCLGPGPKPVQSDGTQSVPDNLCGAVVAGTIGCKLAYIRPRLAVQKQILRNLNHLCICGASFGYKRFAGVLPVFREAKLPQNLRAATMGRGPLCRTNLFANLRNTGFTSHAPPIL